MHALFESANELETSFVLVLGYRSSDYACFGEVLASYTLWVHLPLSTFQLYWKALCTRVAV